MLLALATLAILVAVALPPLAGRQRRGEVRVAARTLEADLARARTAAVLAGRTVTVRLDTLAGSYLVEGPGGEPIVARRLQAPLELRTTAHGQAIPFTARGTSNLYSTTWIGTPGDVGARWHGVRVSPSGAVERR